jgi:hypothetical protein
VDQDVAKACDLLPLDVGVGRPNVGGQLLHRFAYDLEVAKDRIDGGWTIELEPFPGWRDVPTW